MRLEDYVANISVHEAERRTWSHVDHDDLRRWLVEIQQLRAKLDSIGPEAWAKQAVTDYFRRADEAEAAEAAREEKP